MRLPPPPATVDTDTRTSTRNEHKPRSPATVGGAWVYLRTYVPAVRSAQAERSESHCAAVVSSAVMAAVMAGAAACSIRPPNSGTLAFKLPRN